MDGADAAGFGDVRDLGLVLLDAAGQVTVRFDIADAGTETAMVLGEFYLRGEEWKFRAVGQGWDSGLVGLATDYGITVEDTEPTIAESGGAEPGVDVAAVLDPDHDTPTPNSSADRHDAGPEPSADLVDAPERGDRPVGRAAPDRPRPAAAVGPAPARPVRAPTRGVRTRKKRATGAAIAPLTLAVDPSWQPARLFSVSGVGVGEEQEKRATSILMATMMAVRDFGRALVSRFGGPAGTIETYLEVPFTLDERTVIPDAVIRVARAGRVWTALLETKTGASPLRADQVDRYLDLARQQGYDAVITLSNDLAPTAGSHPVEVDGRRLRKVALHHISWSEVLHETEMQLAHRGVDDRLQAWLLAELIRYLQHPRSGAAGFDDMGPAWVPVREAVAAGTLRVTDRKIGHVTTSWDKLVRHLCLQLTSRLGVAVTPVPPRGVARDQAAQAQFAMARLAGDGTLGAVLRVPGAVGAIEVTADLRTGQVRTSVQVDAPREGTGTRRVNWMLRQLKEAPDGLLVEVGFARREQTSCELLKDVRDNPPALLPDPAADVRTFRLSLSAPMARNGAGCDARSSRASPRPSTLSTRRSCRGYGRASLRSRARTSPRTRPRSSNSPDGGRADEHASWSSSRSAGPSHAGMHRVRPSSPGAAATR